MLPQLAFAFNGANLRCPKIRSAIQMAITIKEHRQRVQHKRRPKWFVYKSGTKWLCCKKVAIQRQIMQNNIFPVYSPHKFSHKLLYPEPPPLPGTRSIEFHLSWSVIYPDSAEKKNRSGFRIPMNLTGGSGSFAWHNIPRRDNFADADVLLPGKDAATLWICLFCGG